MERKLSHNWKMGLMLADKDSTIMTEIEKR